MRFTPSFLDEIKARLPVSEVVRRRVKLVKAGREWKGLSPFNAEKSPSFFVNDQKMAWFDFSSGQNGNIFDFVMRTEGLSFPEAVERLAGEAGLQMPVASRESEERERQRASLQDVMELAAAFSRRSFRSRKARGPGAIWRIAASPLRCSASFASAIPRPSVTPCAIIWPPRASLRSR